MASPYGPSEVACDVPIAVTNVDEVMAWSERMAAAKARLDAAATEYGEALTDLVAIIDEGVHLDVMVG